MTLISPITAKAATARIVALVVLGAAGILLAVRAAQSRRGASPVEVEVTGTVRLTDGRVAIGAKVGSRLDLDDGSAVPSISVGSVATTDEFGRFTIKTTAARRQVRLAAIDVQGRHVGLAAVDVDSAESSCRLDIVLDLPPAIDLVLKFPDELEGRELKLYLHWTNSVGRAVAEQSVMKPRGWKVLRVPNRMPLGRYGFEIECRYVESETHSGVVIDRRDVEIDAAISKWGSMVGKEAPELRIAGWHRPGDAVKSLRDLRGKWVILECWAYE